jgi:hypothetical protein
MNEVMDAGNASLDMGSSGFGVVEAAQHGMVGLPEGRVHGGGLMALLSKGQVNIGTATGTSEDGKTSGTSMLSWF